MELSTLLYYLIKSDKLNNRLVEVIEKRKLEIGLVVPWFTLHALNQC